MNALNPHSPIALTPKGEAYAVAHIRPTGCPDGIDPVKWRKALERRCEKLADKLQGMIALLDGIDGDADYEASLGAPEIPPMRLVQGGPYGWHQVQGTQERWADVGAGNDGEEDGGDAPELDLSDSEEDDPAEDSDADSSIEDGGHDAWEPTTLSPTGCFIYGGGSLI